jgi:hypothetical protein
MNLPSRRLPRTTKSSQLVAWPTYWRMCSYWSDQKLVDVVEWGGRAQHRPCRRGPVVLGAVAVLHPDATKDRVQVVGNVAGGVDVGRAAAAPVVDQDPVVLVD